MSIRNLPALFAPKTIAVIGASKREGSLGAAVWRNCLARGFAGSLLPVNPKYRRLGDYDCYHRIHDLPSNVDLALICTPVSTLVDVLEELGRKGVKAVAILREFSAMPVDERIILTQKLREAAKPTLTRILGPGSLGLQVPEIGLQASVYPAKALAGNLAFVSQSASVAVGVIEWAKRYDIGFSKFVSLGETTDIDTGDVLDYLASDGDTRAILLHIEKVEHARKFLSAARAAARSKPVVVIMPRSHREYTDDEQDIDADAIYDAAYRRAGMLRVASMSDLFNAAETLAYARHVAGERLAIVSNGRGVALLAADALIDVGGQLASKIIIADVDRDVTNPISTNGLVDGYVDSLTTSLQDKNNDCVLLIHAPTCDETIEALVNAIMPLMPHASHTLLTCWLGAESAAARHKLAQAEIPVFDTPEQAARGFMQLAKYRRNQHLLMQVPESLGAADVNMKSCSAIIALALKANRNTLHDNEAKLLLAGYGLQVEPFRDISPDFTICMQVDAVFGPVIAIGEANTKAAKVAGLPPLNSVLAADMIASSGLFGSESAKVELSSHLLTEIEIALIGISRLATEVAEIAGISIDLALSNLENRIALIVTRAHVDVQSTAENPMSRLAICPYPIELEHTIEWQGRTLTIRPIKPEDGSAHLAFFSALTPEDVRFRMFMNLRELQPAQLARMTQIDYDREMAFIATQTSENRVSETLGVVRVIADPDNEQAEFAVTVRSDLKARGLGTILMREIINYCRCRGTKEIVGDALANNTRLLNMVTRLGFEVTPRIGDDTMMLRLPLNSLPSS